MASQTLLPQHGNASQSSINKRGNIKKVIEDYEEKYKTFDSLNIYGIELIYSKICGVLLNELNIDIEKLYESDKVSFDLILLTFFGQKNIIHVPPKVNDSNSSSTIQETQSSLTATVGNGITECALQSSDSSATASNPSRHNSSAQYSTDDIPMLSKSKNQLHTTMVMCFVAHTMHYLFKKHLGQTNEQEQFSHLKEYWQDIACDIVNHLHSLGDRGIYVQVALNCDYSPMTERCDFSNSNRPYRDYLYMKFNQSKEIMFIAYKAEAMKFLSQRVCLNFMESRDEPFESGNKKNSIMNWFNEIRLAHWRRQTFKLYFHGIFRIAYIAIFAYVLCTYPIYHVYEADDIGSMDYLYYIPVGYILLVLISQMLMALTKVSDFVFFEYFLEEEKEAITDTQRDSCCQRSSQRSQKFLEKRFQSIGKYFKNNNLTLWKCLMIFPLLMIEALRFLLDLGYFRMVLIPIILEVLYCAVFVTATISSLRFFYSVKSIGFFVHLIKKMGKTVGMFIFIFIVFWMVLAVVHVSISRAYDPLNGTLFHLISSRGKFEIFGEVQDEDRLGTIDNCTSMLKVWNIFEMNYEEASCLFRSSFKPFLVFVYIFGTGILLINLLTAQLTKEYEEESEKTSFYGGYLKYDQLSKIKSKLWLPPPLSLIYIILRMLCRILCISCCSCTYEYLFAIIEGHPYGAVRKIRTQKDAEKEIVDYLERNPCSIWDKLIESIRKFERNGPSIENLTRAQLELFGMLEREKYIESTEESAGLRKSSRPEQKKATQRTNYETIISGSAPIPHIDEDITDV